MSKQDYFQKVNEFLKRMGDLGPLDSDGTCLLGRGDAQIGIKLLPDKDLLMVASPVIKLPETNLLPLFRKLLTLNYTETSDAAFSLNEDFGTIDLQIKRPLEGLDFLEFKRAVTVVGEVADKLNDVLREEFGAEVIRPAKYLHSKSHV